MANNEHRVLKNNTFEDWRQKSNEVSFDLGDNALLDNTRLGDKVYNYTASAGQVFISGNDTASKTLVIEKLPDALIDNTGGYIIIAHGTTIPGAFVNGATVTQGSDYSATIESVVTVDNKSKILVKNSTGTFSTSVNLTVGSASIAHANVERIVSESFPKGSIRIKKGGSELVQDLSEAGFHIANHKGTIALTGSPSVDKVTEGITIYQAGANQTTQAGVEANATWWATVLHSNTTTIKTKNNNGSLNTGADIRILGYAPGSAKVDASKVSSISLNDDSQLHTIELNNEASNSDAFAVITTNLVDAVNELQDDIGTVENLATSTQADVVSAINEIEGVFDASTKEISAGSNAFNVTSGAFTINSSGDITLDADGADIFLKDDGTTYGSLTNSSSNLVIKSGSTTMLTGNGANATFAGNVNLPDSGQAIFGAGSDLKIYHDGSNSYIDEAGTGSFNIRTDGLGISFVHTGGSVNMAQMTQFGTSLMYNGNSKLSTVTGGVNITGEVEADSLDIDGVADISGAVTLQTSATVGTTLGVTGLSTLGSLTVTGATQLNGGLDMDSGKFSVANGTGNTIIDGTLNVDGAVDIDSTLDVLNGTTLRSTLDVTGNTGIDGNFDINTNKFTVASGTGNTVIAGTLGVTGNVSVGTLTTGSQHVKGAINELQSELGSAVFSGGDITDGAASVTAAIGLIETEIGDDEAYNVGGSITYGGNTISAALVSLNNGMKANDTEIQALEDLTLTAGDGLSGGGTLAADRSFAVNVDDSSIEINSDILRVKASGITNAMLNGSIANAKLSNSAITINSQAISLGGSHTFTTANIGENTNLYFTNERVDDRVADFLIAGKGLGKVEDDDNNSLTLNVNSSIAGAGLEWNNSGDGVINIVGTTGGGILVAADSIGVDSTVLRTNEDQTIVSGKTLTVSGTLDLSNASVTFPSGGSGSVQNVGTSFLMITAGQTEQGLKIDRSEIGSHTIDPSIQWDNAKASDIGWEVVYPNPADNAALSSSLVTFANAGKLVDGSTETGITVTHSSDNFNFAVQVDDSSIEVNSSNKLQVKASGITNAMLAGSINASKLAGSIGNGKLSNSSISFDADNGTTHAIALGETVTITGGTNLSTTITDNSLQINTDASPTFTNLTVTGDLNITGDINSANVTDLDVTDKTITVGKGQNAAASTGSGLVVDGSNAEIKWHNTNNRWESNKNISAATFIGALSGNATTATTASAVAWGNVTGKPTLDNYVSWTATDGADSATSYTITSGDALSFIDTNQIEPRFHADDQLKFNLVNNSIGATQLDVSGNGSAGQALISDGDGTMSWSTISGDNTTYDLSVEQTGGTDANPILRLDPSSGSNDDITFTGAGGVSIARTSDTEITITGANTYVLPKATATLRGGVELFSNTVQTVAGNSVSSTAGRTYGVQLNSADQMVVNVPWSDTNTQNPNQQTTFQVEDGDGTEVTISQGKEWKFVEGSENVNASGDDYININWTDTSAGSDADPYDLSFSHKRTARDNDTTNGSVTTSFGGNFTIVDSVTTNPTGHVTGVNTKTITMPANPDTNTFRTVKVDTNGNGSANNTLTTTEDLMLKKGSNITLAEADGVVTISSTNTTYSAATDSTLGLIKTGYTNNSQNYAVDLDGDNEAYVSVPWVNTWNANSSSAAGYVAAGTGNNNKVWKTNGSGAPAWRDDDNTWNANTKTVAGYVAAPGNVSGKVWKTDASGNPAWRDDDNTQYSAATSSALGLIKIGYTDNAKNYAVELDGDNEAYVNVPWENTPQNQNAFSKIRVQNNTVNGTLHEADTTTDTFVINAGTNITISDTTGTTDNITITNDITNVYDGFNVQNSNGTSKFTHSAAGINDNIILRDGSNITITDGGDDIAIISATNTTYSAGTGLDLSGTTFSVESDLRNDVTKIGNSSSGGMSIEMNNTGYADFKASGSTIEFRMTASGDFHADGDVIAYSTTTNSDVKLKDNIQKVTGALELVSQLDGVTFNWKKDGKASAGVIAQNVEEVLPSAVKDVETLNEDDTHKVVDYNQLSALFIEAIKELKEENNLLKAEIESLKDINNR